MREAARVVATEVAALGVAWVAAGEVAKGEGEGAAAWEAAMVAAGRRSGRRLCQ